MRILRLIGVPVVLGVVLSGCSTSLESYLTQEASRPPTVIIKKCLATANDDEKKPSKTSKMVINGFLNCVFQVTVPEENLDLRLLRGHAVVSLLAMYGAFSLKHDPIHQNDDAKRLFGRILAAEKTLWEVSSINTAAMSLTTEQKLLANHSSRHDRIVDVMQVASAALKPAKRRAIGFVKRVISVFSVPTPSGAKGLFTDVRKAVRRAAVVEVKGSDYILGIQALMENIIKNKAGKPETSDWVAVDTIYLDPACQQISFMGYGDFKPCHGTH